MAALAAELTYRAFGRSPERCRGCRRSGTTSWPTACLCRSFRTIWHAKYVASLSWPDLTLIIQVPVLNSTDCTLSVPRSWKSLMSIMMAGPRYQAQLPTPTTMIARTTRNASRQPCRAANGRLGLGGWPQPGWGQPGGPAGGGAPQPGVPAGGSTPPSGDCPQPWGVGPPDSGVPG